MGPGRGSGAGSLVAYALNITTLDPIKHKLLFERFLNPARVSLPDFDIDFCVEGRDRVIEYVTKSTALITSVKLSLLAPSAQRARCAIAGECWGCPMANAILWRE